MTNVARDGVQRREYGAAMRIAIAFLLFACTPTTPPAASPGSPAADDSPVPRLWFIDDHVEVDEQSQLGVKWNDECGNFPCRCQDFELTALCKQPCKVAVMAPPEEYKLLDANPTAAELGKFHCEANLRFTSATVGPHVVTFTLKRLNDGATRQLELATTVHAK